MSDIPSFPYQDLWGERCIESVANLTRQDAIEFLSIAAKIPIETEVKLYQLEEVNRAISDIKEGNIEGSCVLKIANS